MSSESNWSGQQGAQNPGRSADWFRSQGMNGSHADEAAAAARRAQERQNNKS